MIDFEHESENSVILNGISIMVKQYYGLNSNEFLPIYQDIKNRFRLKIKQKYNKQEIVKNGKLYGAVHTEYDISDFIYCCYILDKEGIKIQNLISQFNKSSDLDYLKHSSSLAKLGLVYHRNSHKIEFPPVADGCDILIDGISVELKVTTIDAIGEHFTISEEFISESIDIQGYITSQIKKYKENRMPHAIKQGKMIFFDFSSVPLFSSLFLQEHTLSEIITPQEYRIVFYHTHRFSPGLEIKCVFNGTEKILGVIQTPDIFCFHGLYYDEPMWWGKTDRFINID